MAQLSRYIEESRSLRFEACVDGFATFVYLFDLLESMNRLDKTLELLTRGGVLATN